MAKKVKKHFFKILPISVAVIMILALGAGIWQQAPVEEALAAAPAGTMTATTLLMKGNETKAINPITIVDSGAEITATNNILILIPATFVDTTWDTTDTTATINTTGNTTGTVSTTVSYTTTNYANDTLVLDVTADFTSGDQVIVSDLSFVSANPGTNNSADLLWSVDAGGVFSATSSATLTVDTVAPTLVSIIFGGVLSDNLINQADVGSNATIIMAFDETMNILSVGNLVASTAPDDLVASTALSNPTGFAWSNTLGNPNDTLTLTYLVQDGNEDLFANLTSLGGNVTDLAGNAFTPWVNQAIAPIYIDTAEPIVTGGNVFVLGCSGLGGECIIGDTPVLVWDGDTDGEGDTIVSVIFDGSNFRSVDNALNASDPGTPGTNYWSVGLSGAMDPAQTTLNTIDVTVTDDAGNVTGPITSSVSYTIDTIAPTVNSITVGAGSGTGGTIIIGDTPTVTIVMSEAVTGFDNTDVTMPNGTLGALGTVDNITFTGTFTPNAIEDATNTATVATTFTDTAGNNASAGATSANYAIDTIAPTVISATTADNDSNGQIDAIIVVYSEPVNDVNYDALAVTGYALPGTGAGTGTATLTYDLIESGTADTGATPALTWTAVNAADLAGNILDLTGAPANATDGAPPVIISTSPANGATNVLLTANVIATFSEPMNTGTILGSVVPDPGGLAATWSVGNTIMTISHNIFSPLTLYTSTLLTGQDVNGNTFVVGPVPNPISFTTRSASSSGGGGGVAAPTCSLSINNGAVSTDTLSVILSLTVSGEATEMLISNDQNFVGATWQPLAGSKAWTLAGSTADYGTKTVYALVKNTAGVTSNLCSDTIEYVAPGVEPLPPPEEPVLVPEEDLVLHDPEPAGPLSEGVAVGTLVKRADMDTVYFVDNDNRRHAFPSESVYFSWFEDFSKVQTIAAETLAAIPLGSNVTVRPGTYLVKIQTDPKVYAVEPYGVIRWIQSEAIARSLYGAEWNKRVVDVEPTFFVNYQTGSSVSSASHPTASLIAYEGDTNVYYIEKGIKKFVSSEVFVNNLFQNKFVSRNISSSIIYATGANMASLPIETLMTLR
ncbi:MAG TPA: hypothetical protein ENN28_02615 [Candidatus Uhrbacteria bacterium]|nr:hypothetical protein [Candidatus Uhrbacteria bacterium]